MTIKAEQYFLHFWDEHLSDDKQLPDKGIPALSTRITFFVNNFKFTQQ